jgi:O-antigen/teichoic acid export membrane protein
MIKGLKKYTNSDFTKNVAVMFSGNGLAMIFPFFMAPFISRIFSPTDFAGFELFVKIAALISVVGSLRLDRAIILPKSHNEADAIVKLSFKILFIVATVSLLVSLLFGSSISRLLENKDLGTFIWLLPIAVFALGAHNILTAYAIRLRRFKLIASNKILASLTSNGTKYLLGLWNATGISLVYGQILGVVLPLIGFLKYQPIRNALISIRRQEVPTKVLLKKYRDFPIINSSHAFFDEGQKALLLFLISAYHGAIVLGLFAFAWRYLQIPLQVLGTSLSQVLNEKWARDINEGINIRPAVIKMVWILFAIAIVPFSILFFFGTPIFAFVFGEEWTVAGTYAEWMAPWLLVNFLTNPISFMPILANKQSMSFAIAVVGNVITLSVIFVLSILDFPFQNILLAMVAGNVIFLLFNLFWVIHISGKAVHSEY